MTNIKNKKKIQTIFPSIPHHYLTILHPVTLIDMPRSFNNGDIQQSQI